MGSKILIAEDELLTGEAIRSQVRRLGHQVIGIVDTAGEAVEVARRERPDLVLMDIRLRDNSDGVEAAGRIRDEVGSSIVYLSAYSDPETLRRTRRTAPHGFIVKPYRDIQLTAALHTALSAREREQKTLEGSRLGQTILDVLPDAVLCINVDGMITWGNRSVERLFGYGQAELIGQPVTVLMPEPDRSLHGDYIARYLATRKSTVIGSGRDVRARHRDGREIFVRLAVAEYRLADGTLSFIGIIHDSTARLEAIKRYETIERILENSSSILLYWKAEPGWPVTLASGNLARLGFDRAAVEQSRMRLEQLIHPQDLQRIRGEIAAYESSRQNSFDLKYRIVGPDGSVHWVEDYTVVERDGTGHVVFYQGMVTDVTERRRLEAEVVRHRTELQHAARMSLVEQLAGGVAHEINNPLTALMGGLRRMRAKTADDSPQMSGLRSDIDMAQEMADRMARVVRSLSEFADWSPEEPATEIRVDAVVQSLRLLLSGVFSVEGVDFRTDVEPQLTVWGGRGDVEQALTALLMNARTAAKQAPADKRQVTLKVAAVGDVVEFTVTDQGPGIAPGFEDRVFEPFYTTQAPGRGMGLGLSIARTLVLRHGGSLRLLSPGQPTTFLLTLPRQRNRLK